MNLSRIEIFDFRILRIRSEISYPESTLRPLYTVQHPSFLNRASCTRTFRHFSHRRRRILKRGLRLWPKWVVYHANESIPHGLTKAGHCPGIVRALFFPLKAYNSKAYPTRSRIAPRSCGQSLESIRHYFRLTKSDHIPRELFLNTY